MRTSAAPLDLSARAFGVVSPRPRMHSARNGVNDKSVCDGKRREWDGEQGEGSEKIDFSSFSSDPEHCNVHGSRLLRRLHL